MSIRLDRYDPAAARFGGAPSSARFQPPTVADAARRLRMLLAPALAIGAAALLALAVERFGAPAALGALLVLAAMTAFVFRPGWATLLMVFLLYLNIPAVLTKRLGMSETVAGSFILLLAFPLLHHLFARRERIRFDKPLALMLGLLTVMLLSAATSESPRLALDRVVTYVFEGLVLYWLVVNAVRDLKGLRGVIGALLAAGSLLAVLSLYQDATGSYKQEFGGLAYRNYVEGDGTDPELARQLRAQDWRRAHGPVDEPNRFGQILLVLVPLGMYLRRTASTRRARFWSGAATLTIVGGVIVTLSRGAFVGLAVLAVTFAALRWVRRSQVVALVVVMLLAGPLLAPRVLDRVRTLADLSALLGGNASAHQVDGAVRGRATEMLAAFGAFRDHAVLGVGPGLYAPLYSVEYQQKHLGFRDLQVPRRAHMLYVEIAAELGAVGLTVFMAIVIAVIRRLWQERERWVDVRPELSDLATCFLMSVFAYLTTALTMHLSYQRYYWLLLALAVAALHVMRAYEPSQRITPLAPRQTTSANVRSRSRACSPSR